MTDGWLGIDLGTQSVRAVVLDDDGDVVASAAHPLTSVREGDRHEQDPAEWLSVTRTVLRRVTSALPPDLRIRALAVSGTSGTVVPVDAEGAPVGPAAMYDDRRGAPLLPRVQAAGEALWDRLGYRMQATWGLPKLLALRAAGLPAGSRIAHQPDVLTAWLAGRPLPSDLSSALKSGADLDRIAWPHDVLDRLGVAEGDLNDVAASGAVLGTVSAQAADETGLPAGCRIVAGFTDGCAAQIAAGALTPGSWNSVLGTTLVVKGAAAERRTDPTGAMYAHRAAFEGGWYPGGASSTGAGAISTWLPGRDLDRLTRAAATLPGVPVAYPLVGRGERFPFVSDTATGFGPDGTDLASLDDVALFAAIAHGVAFLERLAYDLVVLTGYATGGDLFLTGGGARNDWWSTLRAEVLGRPVAVPGNAEGAAGMAVLAAAGAAAQAGTASGDPLAEAAARLLPPARRIEPRAGRRAELDDAYGRFVDRLDAAGALPADLALHALAGVR